MSAIYCNGAFLLRTGLNFTAARMAVAVVTRAYAFDVGHKYLTDLGNTVLTTAPLEARRVASMSKVTRMPMTCR